MGIVPLIGYGKYTDMCNIKIIVLEFCKKERGEPKARLARNYL